MPSGRVQYQGFFKLSSQFSNSRNTGKCELGQFLLRQSQIMINLSSMQYCYKGTTSCTTTTSISHSITLWLCKSSLAMKQGRGNLYLHTNCKD